MASSTRWRIYVAGSVAGGASLASFEMAASAGGADLCTGGTASASSVWDSSYTPDKAFDGNASTRWNNANGTAVPQWLEYQFASAVTVAEYRVRAGADNAGNAPTLWKLEYWNGSTWVAADFRSGPAWTLGEARTYTVPATPPLGHKARWRLYITATYNGSGIGASVAELELADYTGGPDLCTSGLPLADSFWDSSYTAAKAFDNNPSTRWNNGPPFANSLPAWLEYQFTSPIDVAEYRISAGNDNSGNSAPSTWELQYWDGAAWIAADTQSGVTPWTAGQTRTYTIDVGPPPALVVRTTQLAVEAFTAHAATARTTQLAVEVFTPRVVWARATQLAVEVFTPRLVATRATQAAVEIYNARAARTRVTQVAVEVFMAPTICVSGIFPIDSDED